MAVVIASDESSHFAPAMRRSHSQPKFPSKSSGFRQSSSASRLGDLYNSQQQPIVRIVPGSPNTSAPPSPRTIAVSHNDATLPSKPLGPTLHLSDRLIRPGYGSSPASTDDGDMDVPDDFGHYDGVSYFNAQDLSVPNMGDSYAPSPNDNNTLSTGPSRTSSSDLLYDHIAEDDTAIRVQPSRHVDYLSHNWREEDIWESWKYIVARRGDYSNSARLENASWRTWMKSKNKLKTVSPETLNWLKDCDVTWLYGPLQIGHGNFSQTLATDSVELTKSNSFLTSSKKPILKKRSMSEIMLQRSLSASSLVKQAAAAVQAQQKDKFGRKMQRPRMERAATDYITLTFSSRRYSPGPSSLMQSNSSSGIVSPSPERKHIHFNEQVEQCIVVEIKGEDDDDDDLAALRYEEDSDSDDGAIMMKRSALKRRYAPRQRRNTPSNESRTIAMLPSTTLKCQEHEDDFLEGSAMKHSYRSPVMSPSSSQETLRPSKMSGKFFDAGDDDEDGIEVEESEDATVVQQEAQGNENEDDDSDDDFGMSMGMAKRRPGGILSSSASTSRLNSSTSTASSFSSSGGGLKRTTSTSSLSAEPAGMRRTASGMFMPYDKGEPANGSDGGLVGRVIDTVNTARDIIHVIWNVGWRK